MLTNALVQGATKNSILIANYMIEQATIDGKHFAYSEKEKMLYCYDGKIYIPFEGIDLDQFFHDFMVQYNATEMWKSSRLAEFERAIKVNKLVPRVEMDDYNDQICFKNGVLDMKTMEFKNHSSSLYFSTFVDVDYDPKVGSEPVAFLTTMEKIFFNTKTGKPDYDTIDLIKCIGGSLIFPKNKLKQLFIFLGGGSNGKSVIMNTFAMFFSTDHTTYLSLEELSTKNKERSRLLKSRINFCSEEKGGTINSEEIKRIVYGEGITIGRMYKEAVEFIPKTKIVVAANSKPYFKDTSYGLERRLTIVNFDNLFLQTAKFKKTKDAEKQGIFLAEDDDDLMAKIRKERTQILNFFLKGLKILVDRKWEMPESVAVKEAKEEYIEGNDTVGTWLKDNYEVDVSGESKILASDILVNYRTWYQDNVSTRSLNFAVNTMGTRINEIFRLKPIRKAVNGKRLAHYTLMKKIYVTDDDTTEEPGDGSELPVGDLVQGSLSIPENQGEPTTKRSESGEGNQEVEENSQERTQ